MHFLDLLARVPTLLTDGAIETRIVYEFGIALDPNVEVTRLVLDPVGRAPLETIYRQYLDAGQQYDLPLQLGTPTFRAGPERVQRAGFTAAGDLQRVNAASVRLLQQLRQERGAYGENVVLAGVVGPRGDAYRPEGALAADAAHAYHTPQAEVLAAAGVDLLFAPTFPAATEALGVARALAGTGLPYVVSFVVTAAGTLLDGVPLAEAIARIDTAVSPRPAYYLLSCIHASVARAALRREAARDRDAIRRVHGLKANTSRRPPAELVALGRLDTEDAVVFADELLQLRQEFGFPVLGGCCGTDNRHIAALAARLAQERDLHVSG